MAKPTRVAVVLCGCGRSDGSEIHESVSCLVHLDRLGASYRCFAPDLPQPRTIDHRTGKPVAETRNMLAEAARIARGEIDPLARLRAGDFDALVVPGGSGVATNLCTFADKGETCEVIPDVRRVISEFHDAGKPIALACIAPVLAARVLGTASGGPGCEVTIGADERTARAIAAMGARNVPRRVEEAHADEKNLVVTTPAYMCDAGPWGVYQGIGEMIARTLELARRPR